MKIFQNSSWALFSAVALTLGTHASSALEVLTLGGGPTQAQPGKAGFANGLTLTDAKFNQPWAIAVEPDGSLLVADRNNSKLREILDPAQDDVSLTLTFAPRILTAVGVAVGRNGLIYSAAQRDGRIRVHSFDGVVLQTYSGFSKPTAIAVDSRTNIYVAELRGRIRMIAPDGTVSDITSDFTSPSGIAVLDTATLAVSDAGAHGIYKVDLTSGVVTRLAGGNGAGFLDGAPAVAKFNAPAGIAIAPNGKLVVADRLNHRVRLISTNGTVSTVYGFSKTSWARPYPGWRDGDELTAVGREPVGVAVGTNGVLYVTEKYWNIVRQVTGLNLLTGSTNSTGGTNAQVIVAAPTFSPLSGFYPMGVTVTVTSTVPVFYTTDGTEPTTNSRPVSLANDVGTIRFTETMRDLTSLRLKAFDGTNASVSVSGRQSSVNDVGLPRDVTAGIGSTLVVPIVVNLSGTNRIRSLQYRVEVTPQNGGPPILPQFRATSISSNDFIQVTTAAAENTEASYNASPYTIGTTRGLTISAIGTNANFDIRNFAVASMLVIPISPDAIEGQTYRVEILYPSATSDGMQNPVALNAMAPKTITVANMPFLVGDSSPGSWYNAGDFGNSDLHNDDVNNVFYASHGVRIPFPYTDVFNSMDAYPPEETGAQGGDGSIDTFDLNLILARSLRDPRFPYNWVRHWSDGGLLMSEPVSLGAKRFAAPKSAVAGTGPGTVWAPQVTLSATALPNLIPGETYNIPIWLKAAPGCSVAGLGMRVTVTPDGNAPGVGPIGFTPLLGRENFLGGNGVAPNEALCTWLMVPSPAFLPSLQGSNLIGYVRFTVPHIAVPGQSYSVRFLRMSGGANMQTPYQFEGIPGKVWVQSAQAQAAEMTSEEWRTHFFASTTSAASDMMADPDNDGVANWQEYIEGTSPVDAASWLHVEQAVVATPNGPAVQLTWTSAALKVYAVERGASANGPWAPLASGIPGDGYVKMVTDDSPSQAAPFYRVRVQP